MQEHNQRIAIVTGASRGIGAAIAHRLASDGYGIAVVARSAEPLAAIAAALPTPALPLACDLREPGAALQVVEAVRQRYGRIDVLVNNAGATPRGDFLAFDDGQWQDGFALKFFGAMRLCRAAWPALVESGGSIVNIAGIGGRTGNAEFAIGGSVNAALLNLTKALADRGIREGILRTLAMQGRDVPVTRREHRK